MSRHLLLVANTGSSSRKYSVFDSSNQLATFHFEIEGGRIVYSLNNEKAQPAGISHIAFSLSVIPDLLQSNQIIASVSEITHVAVRIVAPSPYFQEHRIIDSRSLDHLKDLAITAPLHIDATLQEISLIHRYMPGTQLIGISDSAFHCNMPTEAQQYAIPPNDAQRFNIQRYGYHGLSVSSVVEQLKEYHSLPNRLIVCHLGSGVSVTAVKNGKSMDTSMGYSPLEGVMMATRSGDVDPSATIVLQNGLQLDGSKMQDYLNHKSGLLGVSGLSSDIRVLLDHESRGSEAATLALKMFIHRLTQAVGQMSAVLGGVDGVVFTGTIGERSSVIRNRICKRLKYLGIELDIPKNKTHFDTQEVKNISQPGSPADIYVVRTDEMKQMAICAQNLI